MSKGSSPRPFQVSNQEYANRWDAIFGKDNDSQENKENALEFGKSDHPCNSGSSNNSQGETGQTKTS